MIYLKAFPRRFFHSPKVISNHAASHSGAASASDNYEERTDTLPRFKTHDRMYTTFINVTSRKRESKHTENKSQESNNKLYGNLRDIILRLKVLNSSKISNKKQKNVI